MRGSVRKREKKWYYYFYTKVDGKRKRIERVAGYTRQEALKALNKALYEIDTKIINVSKGDITFNEIYEDWLENYVKINCRYNTIRCYKSLYKNFLKDEIGSTKIKDIELEAGQKLINTLSLKYKKNTLNAIVKIMKLVMDYCITPKHYINTNPFRLIKIPRNVKKEDKIKIISIENYYKFLNSIDKKDKLYTALTLGFNTGMRLGEVIGLTWENVDFENKIIKVKHTVVNKTLSEPKTSSSIRDIYVSNELLDYLRNVKKWQKENKIKYGKYYNDNDLVVCFQNGDILNGQNIAADIVRKKKKLNIDLHFHMLRHTHATILIKNGVPVTEIQKRLGHGSLNTTLSTYVHATEEGQKEIADIFNLAIKNSI